MLPLNKQSSIKQFDSGLSQQAPETSDLISKNKYSIEEDTEFLELAKKLDNYIQLKSKVASSRKREPENEPGSLKSKLKPLSLVRLSRAGYTAEEFTEEELDRIIDIFQKKPFHERRKLRKETLAYLVSLVSRLPFFKPFSPSVIEKLLQGGSTIRMEKDSIVYSEKQMDGHMFIILKGKVEISNKDIEDPVSKQRFEVVDSSVSKVMPLLIGETSSIFAGASANYVGLLNFKSVDQAQKTLVDYTYPANQRSRSRIQFWGRQVLLHPRLG